MKVKSHMCDYKLATEMYLISQVTFLRIVYNNSKNNKNNSNKLIMKIIYPFYLQVANSQSKLRFKANMSERIVSKQIAVRSLKNQLI